MIGARLQADRAYFNPYLPWADALISWAETLADETAAAGEQSQEPWALMIDLLAAGAHAFWALALAASSQRDLAALSRAALAQERTRADLVGLLDPQILVRRPDDTSPLADQYGVLARRELLSSRAREDLAYLTRAPADIDPTAADAILRRLPSGVLAWA